MKVLFVGHYKEKSSSGWGNSSRNYVYALDKVGVNVVSRALQLSNPIDNLPQKLVELENKSSKGADVIIQQVLPHHLSYSGDFKSNISIVSTETTNIKHSDWIGQLNQMDEIWCPCKSIVKSLQDSGALPPITVVPHAIDISLFDKKYQPLDFGEANNDFKFLFVGDLVKRKNLPALIRAFHSEFHAHEPVTLVLKISKFGMTAEECLQHVNNMVGQIKTGLRIYPQVGHYRKDIIITEHLSLENLYRLHTTCDCGVYPSRGEAFSYTAINSLGLGNPIIATDTTSFKDYVTSSNGWLISGTQSPCFGEFDAFPNLFTGREMWTDIDISKLMSAMRRAYEIKDTKLFKTMGEAARATAKRYSYEIIGNQMKKLLRSYVK